MTQLYEIIVWGPDTDIRDEREPDLHAQILLSDQEYAEMDSRLYAMEGEDFVSEYTLRLIETLPLATESDVFKAIVDGQDEEYVADARTCWETDRHVSIS